MSGAIYCDRSPFAFPFPLLELINTLFSSLELKQACRGAGALGKIFHMDCLCVIFSSAHRLKSVADSSFSLLTSIHGLKV